MSSIHKLRCLLKWRHVINHPQFAQKLMLLRPMPKNIIKAYLQEGVTFKSLADEYRNEPPNIIKHFNEGMKKLDKMLKG